MSEEKKMNLPLIIVTLFFAIVGGTWNQLTEPKYYEGLVVFISTLFILLISPLIILWVRALWNTVVPRITGWREITFWEAAGVSAVIALLVG